MELESKQEAKNEREEDLLLLDKGISNEAEVRNKSNRASSARSSSGSISELRHLLREPEPGIWLRRKLS